MSLDLEEQIALQRSYHVRRESPLLEAASAKAIENGLRELIETRYLYQKVTVDLNPVEKVMKPHIEQAPIRAGKITITGAEMVAWQQNLPNHLKALRTEIEKRPWELATRHVGDDSFHAEIHRTASVGTSPVGTPIEKMPIRFYLPTVKIMCGGTCNSMSAFSAHVSSSRFSLESLYPKIGVNGIEQMFHPIFRCEVCRKMTYNVLVHRVGLRLHLCGFGPRRELLASRSVPKPLAPILSDAEQAIAENDVFAGFYHLRTLLEHYLKQRLGIPLEDQIRGEQLVAKHYDTLPLPWRSVLPSISDAYTSLSENLHARKGGVEDFQKLRDKICDHIDMLAMMDRQGSASGTVQKI